MHLIKYIFLFFFLQSQCNGCETTVQFYKGKAVLLIALHRYIIAYLKIYICMNINTRLSKFLENTKIII